jgi:hypothetical protein
MAISPRKLSSVLIGVFALVVVLTASAVAQTTAKLDITNINIKNFGQMDDRFFRGGQPQERDYRQLASLGIKTVIDLTDDPKSYERPAVEALGMRYVNIPMSDSKYPEASQITQFLKTSRRSFNREVFRALRRWTPSNWSDGSGLSFQPL